TIMQGNAHFERISRKAPARDSDTVRTREQARRKARREKHDSRGKLA
ncbi:TPA: hypothetical protein PJG28_004798, partial [Escherichia coli]|nr:hypothetical protein [Escherichia coli]